jgi:hypothetical protein
MKLSEEDHRKLSRTLDELSGAVENLLLTGLTTASEATRQSLQVAFLEASRLRLLRLGSTLRAANEELGRFVADDADFSARRLTFFLNRTWLLARGLARALKNRDAAAFDDLVWTPPQEPMARIEVIVLGVVKKVVARSFVTFDFRLRSVKPAGNFSVGQRLSWSCVFPQKSGQEIPAEAFLHLPQKQKFTAMQFLEGKTMVLEKVAVSVDGAGLGRLSLTEQTTVTPGDTFEDYGPYVSWDSTRAVERIKNHQHGPLDLEVELQEEAIFDAWELGEPLAKDEEKQWWYPLRQRVTEFTAVVPATNEGKSQKKMLDELGGKKSRPPLFGLVHYEKCRLMVQPLTVFAKDGPQHLMLSPDKIDRATLLKALRF